jgi:hypothetical protein
VYLSLHHCGPEYSASHPRNCPPAPYLDKKQRKNTLNFEFAGLLSWTVVGGVSVAKSALAAAMKVAAQAVETKAATLAVTTKVAALAVTTKVATLAITTVAAVRKAALAAVNTKWCF